MPNSPASEQPATREGDEPERAADELLELRKRNAELDDRYRRALADLDNFRKRSVRIGDSRVEEAREALIREWLEAVDSVERALAMTPDGAGAAEGLRAVLEQMATILDRQGVRRFGAAGEPFDPERHEAVAAREGEAPEHTILDVARSGYELGDRVLRPAQVVVSRRTGGDA
jgi:molecular chaperone GrpE